MATARQIFHTMFQNMSAQVEIPDHLDPFATLNVAPTVPPQEVKNAFRSQIRSPNRH